MSRPKVTVFDLETNDTSVREMNDEEYAQYLKDQESESVLAQVNE